MNTFKLHAYRINGLIFLLGLLLLAFVQRQDWQPLLVALGNTVDELPTAQQLAPLAETPALLLLQADALVLPMTNGTAQLLARVRDAQGNPVAGITVQFQSDLGSVNPASAITDANGAATTIFQTAGAAGRALVTATANGLSRETAIQLVNPVTNAATNVLTVDFGANQLNPGQEATITAVLRDAAGQPVAGELVTLFGSLGEVTPTSAMSDASGRVSATYRAGPNGGAGMITALAGVASQSVAFQVAGQGTPGLSQRAFLPLVRR